METDMTRQQKEKAPWEKLAAGYDDNALRSFKDAYALSIQKVIEILPPNARVLEIGCGSGIISLGIAPFARQVIGADISPRMIDIARGKAVERSIHNVEFQVYDGYALPFPDGDFDVVLLYNLLHVVKEPGRLLREARRLLKPEGRLSTATDCYAEPTPFNLRLALHAQRLLKVLGIIPYITYYKKTDLRRLLERDAFEVIDEATLHPAPLNYYLLARKSGAASTE